ncbi:MAG: HPr family phosphocarrier protein [Lachnospiraceae bacterium]|jgi:phosphocarrier protein|nr:HPr family phosphocarrier protein [Lachnospiraceae bacterium]
MKEFTFNVKDENGIHARPAGLLVKEAKKFASSITVDKDGKTCDMKKLLALMGMGIKQGETITVRIEGEDEEPCAAAIEDFLNNNF